MGEGGGRQGSGRRQPCEEREVLHNGHGHLGSPLGRSTSGWGRKAAGSVGGQQEDSTAGETATQRPAQDVQDGGGPDKDLSLRWK